MDCIDVLFCILLKALFVLLVVVSGYVKNLPYLGVAADQFVLNYSVFYISMN